MCKLKNILPNFNVGLQYLNSEIKMEKGCFNMKWQPFEVALANVHG